MDLHMSLGWDQLAASGKMRRSLRFAGPPRRLSPHELRWCLWSRGLE